MNDYFNKYDAILTQGYEENLSTAPKWAKQDELVLLNRLKKYKGPGVEFCVSDIRQSQEWRCRNRAEKGLNALLTSAPEARDGMRTSA